MLIHQRRIFCETLKTLLSLMTIKVSLKILFQIWISEQCLFANLWKVFYYKSVSLLVFQYYLSCYQCLCIVPYTAVKYVPLCYLCGPDTKDPAKSGAVCLVVLICSTTHHPLHPSTLKHQKPFPWPACRWHSIGRQLLHNLLQHQRRRTLDRLEMNECEVLESGYREAMGVV